MSGGLPPPPPPPPPPQVTTSDAGSICIPTLPPNDEEIKTRIDKLVSYVARNGIAFIDVVKNKEKDNPQFSFLFDGDHSMYFQWRLECEIRKYNEETIRQILQQHAGRIQSTPLGTIDLSKSDKAYFQELLKSNTGSKDCIRTLRQFIIARAHSAAAIGKEMKLYAKFLVSPTPENTLSNISSSIPQFTKILHIIYVINDVFFNRSSASFRGPYSEFISAITPNWNPAEIDVVKVLLPQVCQILKMAQKHSTDSSEKDKLMKLVELWTAKQFLSESQATQCRDSLRNTLTMESLPDPILFPPHIIHLPPSSAPPIPQQPHSNVASTQFFPTPPAGFSQATMSSPPPPFRPPPGPPFNVAPPIPPVPRTFCAPAIDLHTIPVGMMADIVRSIVSNGHPPHNPLSIDDISRPSVTPSIEPGRLEARVLDFYRKLEKVKNNEDDDRRSRKRSRGNSLGDELEPYNHSAKSSRNVTEDIKGLGWNDGEGLAPVRASEYSGHGGLGESERRFEGGNDFTSYRSNQSAGYHHRIAEKEASRKL